MKGPNERRWTKTPEERFWSYVDKGDTCWTWTAGVAGKGYGHFWDGQRYVRAHRFAYELLVGPIPDGLRVDHLCRNKLCVNPDHLEPVTNRENIMRGEGACAQNARKTHCPQGHEYSPENTHLYRGWRFCKECRRTAERERYRRNRAAALAVLADGADD